MSSFDSLGPPPPPPTLTRSYNTDRENMSVTAIQANERTRQAKNKVKNMKKNMKIDNLALATLQQGVKSFQNIPVQREFKKMLGLKLKGGSRRQRTHKRKQNKRKSLHKRKTHKRKTHKRRRH